MKKNDWMGLMVSLAVHALVLFGLTLLSGAAPEPASPGFIEVELGPFSEGRPVQRSVEDEPVEEEEEVQAEEAEEPQPEKAPPEESRPVDLPDQSEIVQDNETVEAPEAELVSPETKAESKADESEETQPEKPEIRPLGSGAEDGRTGADDGKQGDKADADKAAPYQIEGLNREATFAPTPPYDEKVNATIRVRIVVDPKGRVISAIPTLKGSPGLENAIQETLRQRWRFNPLPPNVPQTNQTGFVTFRFRLE